MTTATVRRRPRALTRPRLPRVTARRIGVLLGLVVILIAAWFWFRSSSLVAVKRVTVTGLSGPDVGQIRSTLTGEARKLTTLDISNSQLKRSVSDYRQIAGVTVSTDFPHTVTIRVNETIPVATIVSGGRQVAVDRAGLLLPRMSTGGLPRLPVAPDSGGDRATAAGTLATLAVLGAAPYELLGHLDSARSTAGHGVTVQLSKGPVLYFGNTNQLKAKWQAAVGVLANAHSAGASYIDVSEPDRPAAGTGSSPRP